MFYRGLLLSVSERSSKRAGSGDVPPAVLSESVIRDGVIKFQIKRYEVEPCFAKIRERGRPARLFIVLRNGQGVATSRRLWMDIES